MPALECPICARRIAYQSRDEVPHRPFCSRRCQLIDLGRWLNEEYRITEEVPADGDAGKRPSDPSSPEPEHPDG